MQVKKKFKIIFCKKRKGDMEQIIANNKRIRNVLNWKPKKNNLKTIVNSSLNWEKKIKLY